MPASFISNDWGAPALAGRVRYDRMRAGVQACVAGLVPWVHVRQAEIAAASFDVEGGNGAVVGHDVLAEGIGLVML